MDADGTFTVTLDGGRPWGLRLQGGYEYAQRIRVAKVGIAVLLSRPFSKSGDKTETMAE